MGRYIQCTSLHSSLRHEYFIGVLQQTVTINTIIIVQQEKTISLKNGRVIQTGDIVVCRKQLVFIISFLGTSYQGSKARIANGNRSTRSIS